MDRFCFTFLFVCWIAISGCYARLKMEINPEVVMTTTQVVIKCEVIGMKGGQMITWYKRQLESSPDVIGFNNAISNPAYSERFSASPPQNLGDDLIIFVLNILTAQPEDSGEYGCSVIGDPVDDIIVYAYLTVLMPIRETVMYALRSNDTNNLENAIQLEDDQTMYILEGQEFYIRCVAKGSNPAAEVTMRIGVQNDITSRFESKIWNYLEDPAELKTAAMRYILFDSVLDSYEPMTINRDYNGMRLFCTSRVPEYEPVTVSFKPVFKGLPTATCEGAFVPNGTPFVKLVCKVEADPPLTRSTWSWQTDGQNHTLSPGEPGFSLYGASSSIDEETGLNTVQLMIERTYPYVYGEFYFYAENDMGRSFEIVTLTRDTASESSPGGGSRIGAVSAVYYVIFLLITAIRNLS